MLKCRNYTITLKSTLQNKLLLLFALLLIVSLSIGYWLLDSNIRSKQQEIAANSAKTKVNECRDVNFTELVDILVSLAHIDLENVFLKELSFSNNNHIFQLILKTTSISDSYNYIESLINTYKLQVVGAKFNRLGFSASLSGILEDNTQQKEAPVPFVIAYLRKQQVLESERKKSAIEAKRKQQEVITNSLVNNKYPYESEIKLSTCLQ